MHVDCSRNNPGVYNSLQRAGLGIWLHPELFLIAFFQTDLALTILNATKQLLSQQCIDSLSNRSIIKVPEDLNQFMIVSQFIKKLYQQQSCNRHLQLFEAPFFLEDSSYDPVFKNLFTVVYNLSKQNRFECKRESLFFLTHLLAQRSSSNVVVTVACGLVQANYYQTSTIHHHQHLA